MQFFKDIAKELRLTFSPDSGLNWRREFSPIELWVRDHWRDFCKIAPQSGWIVFGMLALPPLGWAIGWGLLSLNSLEEGAWFWVVILTVLFLSIALASGATYVEKYIELKNPPYTVSAAQSLIAGNWKPLPDHDKRYEKRFQKERLEEVQKYIGKHCGPHAAGPLGERFELLIGLYVILYEQFSAKEYDEAINIWHSHCQSDCWEDQQWWALQPDLKFMAAFNGIENQLAQIQKFSSNLGNCPTLTSMDINRLFTGLLEHMNTTPPPVLYRNEPYDSQKGRDIFQMMQKNSTIVEISRRLDSLRPPVGSS